VGVAGAAWRSCVFLRWRRAGHCLPPARSAPARPAQPRAGPEGRYQAPPCERAKQPFGKRQKTRVRPGHLLQDAVDARSNHARGMHENSGAAATHQQLSGRRISPQAGVWLLRALACQRYALGVLVLQHEGPFSCCMLLRPAPTVAWQAGAGSLTRCFATPDPRATALAEPILAACVLLPLSPSLYAHDSTLRFCVCKVISGLSLSCQSVCLSSAVAHSAGLIRPGGFAVSTVAATPLH
jgi:hypothetical protein